MKGKNNNNSIVLPTSITIYNLIPNQLENIKNDHHKHRLADTSLLQSVTLQIIRKMDEKQIRNSDNKGFLIDTLKNNVEVLKELPQVASFRPKWDDLNDIVSSLLPNANGDKKVQDYLSSLYARFVLTNNKKITIGDTISLYPPYLRIIPKDTALPNKLPQNTILLTCSDACLRMNPNIHDILVSKNMLPLLPSPGHTFCDDVFDMLSADTTKLKPSSSQDDGNLFNDDLFSLLGSNAPTSPQKQELILITQPSTIPPSPPHPPEQQSLEAQQYHLLQLQQHLSTLEDVFKFETQQYAQDEKNLRLEMDRLQELLDSYSDIHHQSKLLELQTQKELAITQTSHENLSSRQKTLLKQLVKIYPIQEINNISETRYTIRAIELPNEITYSTSYYSNYYYYSTSNYDDQISTALGYTAHLLSCIAEYYTIALRYPIVCNASRSMIKNVTVYPLFKMSLVEKEMLEGGLELLRRDVDCVCFMLMGGEDNGFEQGNILARLNELIRYLLRDD